MKPWFYRRAKAVPFGAYVRFYPVDFRGWAFLIVVGLLLWLVWYNAADWFGLTLMLGGVAIAIRDALMVGVVLAGLGTAWRMSVPDPEFETGREFNTDEEIKNA